MVEISQKEDMDGGSPKLKEEGDDYGSTKVGLRRKAEEWTGESVKEEKRIKKRGFYY